MKENISIMAWINRFLMIPFLTLLLFGVIEKEFWILASVIAFLSGIYQVVTFFLSLLYLNDIDRKRRNLMLCYLSGVVLYFSVLEFFEEFLINDFRFLIPILLSIFWTYILESLKKEI